MIKIRLDVDYPYPFRLKSFIATGLNLPPSKNYLKNSKIIAKMVNESLEDVRAYWFFTPYTVPDKELLALLNPERHEVALHVATDAYDEWKRLEHATNRKVKYYTVHGTERLIARLMWKRGIKQAKAPIPMGFPLRSFYDFPTLPLDWLCYRDPPPMAVKFALGRIRKGEVMHVHPEWLFQHGTLNKRGPYYETLKTLLKVDEELYALGIGKRGFVNVAKFFEEYEYLKDAPVSARFFEKLSERGADIYTFIERKWCCPLLSVPKDWFGEPDNIASLQVPSYEDWLSRVGKKTRNMIRKAEKNGVKTEVIQNPDQLVEGIWKIYNETPIRQGRAFPYYGISTQEVKQRIIDAQNRPFKSIFIGSYLDGELVGFVHLFFGDQIVVMVQILSMQKHWDKSINNALVAKAVEVCAEDKAPWLMYGRMGNHPSLDAFKESNGFTKYEVTRYYVPLTRKGKIAVKLGLHRQLKDSMPNWLRGPAIRAVTVAGDIKAKTKP